MILTTHTGSLPRPDFLESPAAVRAAVYDVAHRQASLGLNILGDGEMSKPSYVTYVERRLTGFGGARAQVAASDLQDYPEWAARLLADPGLAQLSTRGCEGPVRYVGSEACQRDIDNLRYATEDLRPEASFLTAASPGVIALFFADRHYGSHADYVDALANAMRSEYAAIVEAGFILQIDAPDLAMGFHVGQRPVDLAAFRERAALHVERLNHATRDLPPERMRLHLCWGNYEGPHHHDVELRDIIDIILRARPAGLSFPAANPRHEHEWAMWEDVDLPAGKVLLPGVIDPTTNYIEHPDLVAERILRFARTVGPERVIASTDCGFGTFAQTRAVVPTVAWAKLESLTAGADRARRRL